MKSIVGVFAAQDDARKAVAALEEQGVEPGRINVLTPGASAEEVERTPTSDTEQPGMGKALGGVVGGAIGASFGLGGAAAATAALPPAGLVTAIGAAAAALLGAGGAAAGAGAGGTLEDELTVGLPRDELYVYTDALAKGRTVVIVLSEDDSRHDALAATLRSAGAESLDAAREQWWVGLRDQEEARYPGGHFGDDEPAYRRGFEAAQRADGTGRSYDEAKDALARRDPEHYDSEAYRRGYARGLAYREERERAS